MTFKYTEPPYTVSDGNWNSTITPLQDLRGNLFASSGSEQAFAPRQMITES